MSSSKPFHRFSLASVSDDFGRRPIYLFTFLLYDIASLGLALNQSSYAALLMLRAVQSQGASAALSLCYGTVADITTPATRGKLLGPMLAMGNVGTRTGPIVGDWIAIASGSFTRAFWALFIFGAVMFVAMAVILPETARNVIGNGSIGDERVKTVLGIHEDFSSDSQAGVSHPFKLKRPFLSLRLIFYKVTFLILWISSSYYAL